MAAIARNEVIDVELREVMGTRKVPLELFEKMRWLFGQILKKISEPAGREQLAAEIQSFTQVREVRVDSQRPRISEGLDCQDVVGLLPFLVLRRIHPLLE